MSHVKFDDIKARQHGPASRRDECIAHPGQSFLAQWNGGLETVGERDIRRSGRHPGFLSHFNIAIRQVAIAPECTLLAGFSSAMIDLDRRFCTVRFDHMNDLAHAFDLTVLPEPGIAVGDPSLPADRGLLHEHEPGAAHGELAVMNQMEGRDVAVLGRIHSHR